ncbi:class I adenylate-forming enzyme family protein [Streptomyces phaeochromogenes]
MRSLAGLLPLLAHRYGEHTALVTDDRSLSFRELDILSTRVATVLARRGWAHGSRITLYAGNRWEWLVAYHGILKAGFVVNPLNVLLTADEVAYVVADAGVTAVIGAGDRLEAVRERSPRLEAVIAFDDPPPGCEAFDDLLTGDAPSRPLGIEPAEIGAIAYTSGTTGHPKGAVQPSGTLVTNVVMTATMHGRQAGETMITALPLPHVYGNVAVHATLLTGGTVVLQRRFEAGEALELIERHDAQLFEGVPAMYAALLAHEDIGRRNLMTLTRSTVGGQTMAIERMREWEERTSAPLVELWGMTELAGLGTTHPVVMPPVHGSIGVALPGIDVDVFDLDDQERRLPPGEEGELMVRGPIVMSGYWGREEATREVLRPDGWLRTGDIAHRSATNHLFVVDRRKDMILTAGYNVYPAEIERVLSAHPAVSMVAVGKRADDVKGELAEAYVVLRPGQGAGADELLAHCREQLAAYKVPRAVHFVEELPTTSTGKIMRRRLGTSEPLAERA